MKKSTLLFAASVFFSLIGMGLSERASEIELKSEVDKAVEEKMAASEKEKKEKEGS